MAGEVYSSSIAFSVFGSASINVRATLGVAEILARGGGRALASLHVGEVLARGGGRALAAGTVLEVLAKKVEIGPYIPIPGVLPWTIRPTWENGVTERLKWKTDVLTSTNGTEQRRRLRASPRREIEAVYRTDARTRCFLDACLTGPASQLWQVPLWWDKYDLKQEAQPGAAALIVRDLAFGELQVGDRIMLLDRNSFQYDLAIVGKLLPDVGIVVLATTIQRFWPEGASFYNTRSCRLQAAQKPTRKGSDASDVTLTFETVAANDYPAIAPPNADPGPALQLEFRPNFANDLTTEYARLYATMDNETGLTARRDMGGRAFHVMQFEHITVGRVEQQRFRGFLYWMQGKLRQLLVPSYSHDMQFLDYATAEAGNLSIFIIAAGYSQFTGPQEPDCNLLCFFMHDGTVFICEVQAVNYFGADGYGNFLDTVLLKQPLPRRVDRYNLDKISFLRMMRQDQDDFEVVHETDSTGAARFSTTFRSVGPARVSVPYTLVFDGAFTKSDAPAQLPIDINRYLPPIETSDPHKSDFQPSVSGGPEGDGGGDQAGTGDNAGSGAGDGEGSDATGGSQI